MLRLKKSLIVAVFIFVVILFIAILSGCSKRSSVDLRVAVAANFHPVLHSIIAEFEQLHHIKVELVAGATGQLSEQIRKGLPVDVFLAADSKRPKQLETESRTIEGSRNTYAQGQLVLYSTQAIDVQQAFIEGTLKTIAVANDQLAPYGRAAIEVLKVYGQSKVAKVAKVTIVTANNVAGVRQLIENGADAGFLPLSMVRAEYNYWLIPNRDYSPIIQQMVIVKTTRHRELSLLFQQWLLSESVQKQLHQKGYLNVS